LVSFTRRAWCSDILLLTSSQQWGFQRGKRAGFVSVHGTAVADEIGCRDVAILR
jgi:hypothetical protein